MKLAWSVKSTSFLQHSKHDSLTDIMAIWRNVCLLHCISFAVSCRAIRKSPWNPSKCGKTTWCQQYAEIGAPEQLHKGNGVRLWCVGVISRLSPQRGVISCLSKLKIWSDRIWEHNAAHWFVRRSKLCSSSLFQCYHQLLLDTPLLGVAAVRPSCARHCGADRNCNRSAQGAKAQW